MFDVFLSHNSKDKQEVEIIAARLRDEAGIEPFLDKWHLIPGQSWQPALEDALKKSTTVAVFIGPSGISPWHNEEVRAALSRAVRTKDEYRVIPVLLPGSDPNAVTGFLAERTWVDFRTGLDKSEPFQRLVTGVKGVARAIESFTLPDEPAPYRGLLKFERQHTDRFFGREREIETVLGKLERSNFVAVIGASGAGKSSLVLAGVLPKLSRFKSWVTPISTFVLTPGANPVRALADQAATLLPLADRLRAADELEERMLRRTDGLRTAVTTWTADAQGTKVLVIDQLEELFTHAAEKNGAQKVAAFADNLHDAIENGAGHLRVIATIRADFIDRCLQVEKLRALLQDHDVLLGAMNVNGLRDAIVRPASACGAYFETGVVSALMRELERQPAMLPLLEHALDQLWHGRKGVWLTHAAYEEMGGVTGALKKHADECWERISPADRQVARDIFLRLVSLGEDVPDTRRRVQVGDLYTVGAGQEQVDRVLQALSGPDGRLLVIDHAKVEVAHEILIQEWPTLRNWVDSTRLKLRIHRRVTEAAQEWNDHGRAPGYLLTGARLLDVEENFGSEREGLNRLEADLVAASARARDEEAHLAEERRRRELEAARQLAEIRKARVKEQEEATKQLRHERNLARSRELAGAALRELRTDPQLALLLIQEAYRIAPTELVNEALRKYRSQSMQVSIKTHSGWVASAAFSPDGRQVITAGADGVARLWDVASGKELGKLNGESSWLRSAEFSPDGQRVVTGGQDGTARIWNMVSQEKLTELVGHSSSIWSTAFSPDGQRVVTAGADGIAYIWEVDSGKKLAELKSAASSERSAAFSPDGRQVVTAGADGIARVWDATNGKELRTLEGHTDEVWKAAFSPDGRLVVTAGEDGTVRMWAATSGRKLGTLKGHSGEVTSAAFSPDGRRVITAGEDGVVRVWDAVTRKEMEKLEGHTGWVWSAAFSPDGQRVVTAGADGTARVWNAAGQKELGKLTGHSGTLESARFSPDGQWVVTAGEDGTVRVWDAASRKELGTLQDHGSRVQSVAFSPDGLRVLTAGEDGDVRVWDAVGRKELGRLKGHVGAVPSVAFSLDGFRVVTAGEDATVRIWDMASQKQIGSLEGHSGEVWSAEFSPDGLRVVTAGEDKVVRIWDVTSQKELERLEGHAGRIWSVEFSPDGQRVVTAGDDGTARVWDVAGRRELGKLGGELGRIWSAEFSPDGRRVVTAGADGTARVWDATSRKELGTLEAHTGWVRSAEFSPDGHWVVTAGENGTARIWPSWMWEPADDRILALDAGRDFTPEERRRFLHEGA